MSKLISDLRKAYVDVLAKHGKIYHFDDTASSIINNDGGATFTEDEAEMLDTITDTLYDEELLALAWDKVLLP